MLKTDLIVDIYNKIKNSEYGYDYTGDFLAYLYPAIILDEKCQLWGSDSNDVISLFILKKVFDNKHDIWNYIEIKEEECFIIPAKYCTKWKSSWEFELESCCQYDILNGKILNNSLDINENVHGEKIGESIKIDIGGLIWFLSN